MLDEISTHVLGGFVYQTIGVVSPSTRDVAEDMMSELSVIAPRPVTRARLKIHHDGERPATERYLAQGSMEIAGLRLRTEAAASTAEEALSFVGRGLDRRLQMISERRSGARRRPPTTAGGRWWRDGYRTLRPHYRERPVEERLLLRRKTFRRADAMSVEDALLGLALLDFRMFLFTNQANGISSIVYETTDGIALGRIDGSAARSDSVTPWVILDSAPAPAMTTTDALAAMNRDNSPFLYFQVVGQREAAVIYRRFDGHYGLIVPI